MITEKLSLSKTDFPPIILGAVISYLITAVFLHSGPPEILELTAKTCFLLILVHYFKKIGITVPALNSCDLSKIRTDSFIAGKYFTLILVSAVILISLVAGILALCSHLSPAITQFLENATKAENTMLSSQMPQAFRSPLRTFSYLSTLCVVAPLAEEIFFRRFLFVYLRKKYSKTYAITGSAAIFGVVHFEGFVVASIMGVILAYIYEKEEKLTIPIFIHALKNSTAILTWLAYYYIS